MNTRWNMTFFLFMGMLGAAVLVWSILHHHKDRKRPVASLIAAICAAVAFGVILFGLNHPAKIVNILGSPKKGFSGAVLMQIIVIFTGVITFTKLRNRNYALSIASVLIAALSVAALSKVYMISTRSALNSYLLTVVMIFMVLQASAHFDNSARSIKAWLAVNIIYGISVLVFMIRLGGQQDRVLDLSNVLSGSLAPLFWSFAALSFIIPFACWVISAVKGKIVFNTSFYRIVNAMGMFLFCVFVNQMPVFTQAINNRIFF